MGYPTRNNDSMFEGTIQSAMIMTMALCFMSASSLLLKSNTTSHPCMDVKTVRKYVPSKITSGKCMRLHSSNIMILVLSLPSFILVHGPLSGKWTLHCFIAKVKKFGKYSHKTFKWPFKSKS